MPAITVTISARKEPENLFKVGEFVRIKKRRRVKDQFMMITSAYSDTISNSYNCNLISPKYLKKKNGYTVDRLRKIYKHKPKKSYF